MSWNGKNIENNLIGISMAEKEYRYFTEKLIFIIQQVMNK